MSEYRKGHPVLGVVLGIIGILAGFMGFLTGIIGGGIALLVGVIALVLGIKAGKRGAIAVIAGVLAIVMAVVGALGSIGMVETLREEAEKNDKAPLLAKYVGEKPCLGFLGILLSIPREEGDLQALMDEIDALNDRDTASGTEAPVESAAGCACFA